MNLLCKLKIHKWSYFHKGIGIGEIKVTVTFRQCMGCAKKQLAQRRFEGSGRGYNKYRDI